MSNYNGHLWILNDRITSSKSIKVGRIILPDEMEKFSSQVGSILYFSLALSRLPIVPEVTLNMLDFDDTLYSRYHQLQLPLLQDNRWSSGNDVLRDIIWYDDFLRAYYNRNDAVRRLLRIIDAQDTTHKALILTAWEREWQTKKINTIGLSQPKVPIEVVANSQDKPRKLLEYIISLGYIPWKIIIYEDKPEYFLDIGETLSKLLPGTEIVVDKITLSQRSQQRQIEKIEQTLFLSTWNL